MTRPVSSAAHSGQTSSIGTGTATYEIRVAGHLDDHWAAMLDDLTLARLGDGTTRLTGPLVDQAQLHGLLGRIRDLGAPLLTLRTVNSADPALLNGRRHTHPKSSDEWGGAEGS